jgi:hypothetical protein
MLVRGVSLLVFAAIAGCTTMPMPHIPNEPPINNLALNGPIVAALSPFRIMTNQGMRTYISSSFSRRHSVQGWQAGQEYPIATQTITEELQNLGITVVVVLTEDLLLPGMIEKLDFLLSGTVQPLRLAIRDNYSGNYTEGKYRLSLKVVDARSGETVWEEESVGQGSLMNDPEVKNDLAMSSNIIASLSQNEDRISRLIITNAFRSMMRAHAEEVRRIFTTRIEQSRQMIQGR